jgi:hypothetical protein
MGKQVNLLMANIRAAARPQADKRPAARKCLAADNSRAAGAADNNSEEEAGKPGTREGTRN